MSLSPPWNDRSLAEEGLHIAGFVCSNLAAGPNRHDWLVEIVDGRTHGIYDSVRGYQLLTQEVSRTLFVTGVLFCAPASTKPCLRNADLDCHSGKVTPVNRAPQPVKVASRKQTCKLMNFLVSGCVKLQSSAVSSEVLTRGKKTHVKTSVKNLLHYLGTLRQDPKLACQKAKAKAKAQTKSSAKAKAKALPKGKAKAKTKAKGRKDTQCKADFLVPLGQALQSDGLMPHPKTASLSKSPKSPAKNLSDCDRSRVHSESSPPPKGNKES